MSTTTTEVTIIEASIDTIRRGGEILQANQIRKDKALAVGKKILAEFAEKGMSADLATRASNYLGNIKKAISEMNENRKPVTQILDSIAKEFTACENALTIDKAGTTPNEVLKFQNEWLKMQAEIEAQKKREADKVLAIESEKIKIKTEIEGRMLAHIMAMRTDKVKSLQTSFDAITLDNYDAKREGLHNYTPAYPLNIFANFNQSINAIHISASDAEEIIEEVKVTYAPGSSCATEYITALTECKQRLITLLPSKRTELEVMANASKAEAEAMQAQMKARAEADKLKAESDASEALKLKEQQLELEQAQAKALADFNNIQTTAVLDEPAVANKKSLKIEVKHPVGFTLIFQLWWTNVGQKLDMEKIGNTKLDQMKAWAEKEATGGGAKIESPYISYIDEIKAVIKKAK